MREEEREGMERTSSVRERKQEDATLRVSCDERFAADTRTSQEGSEICQARCW